MPPKNPPRRAGGAGKSIFPIKVNVPPSVPNINTAAAADLNNVTSSSAAATASRNHNSSSGSNNNSSSHSDHGAPLNDQQRLNLAYSKYLQTQATVLLLQKMQGVKRMEKDREFLTALLKSDYSKGFIKINTELSLYYKRQLILKRLLQTNKFVSLYTALKAKFQEDSSTMEELQKALGAAFDHLETKNLDGCGDVQEEELDVDNLIDQVKQNLSLAPDERKNDGKSFLLRFTQAIRAALTEAQAIDQVTKDGSAADTGLLKLSSMKMSEKMILSTNETPEVCAQESDDSVN